MTVNNNIIVCLISSRSSIVMISIVIIATISILSIIIIIISSSSSTYIYIYTHAYIYILNTLQLRTVDEGHALVVVDHFHRAPVPQL